MNDNEEICEPLKIRRLDINDRISNFNCGDEDLNDFILNESQLYRGEMLAVTYVIEDNKCTKAASWDKTPEFYQRIFCQRQ